MSTSLRIGRGAAQVHHREDFEHGVSVEPIGSGKPFLAIGFPVPVVVGETVGGILGIESHGDFRPIGNAVAIQVEWQGGEIEFESPDIERR